ncbi:hypothetical protein BX600DRAFT_528150 [Xylariales sp. PMI_506]|nr:hypothetical protein BX600DRAFT_528150 [Xylariales sp. PMI_506]
MPQFYSVLALLALVHVAWGSWLTDFLPKMVRSSTLMTKDAATSAETCFGQTPNFTIFNVEFDFLDVYEGPYFEPNGIDLIFFLNNSVTQNETLCIFLNLGSPDWDKDDSTWNSCQDTFSVGSVEYGTSGQFEWFGGYNLTITNTWSCVDPTTQ